MAPLVRRVLRELRRVVADLVPGLLVGDLNVPRGLEVHVLKDARLITINPCSLLTRDDRPARREPKQDHVWSDDEIEAVITAAERLAAKPEARYDYAPLIRIALSTGLRLGELLGLTWVDIDLDEGVLHVRRQWTRLGEYAPPKTSAAIRRVPLSADVVSYGGGGRYRRRLLPLDAPRLRQPDDRAGYLVDDSGQADGARVLGDHRAPLHPPLRSATHR